MPSTHVRPTLLPTPLQSTLTAAASSGGGAFKNERNKARGEESKEEGGTHARCGVGAPRQARSSTRREAARVANTHLAGHLGRDAVYNKLLAQGYWWPAMRKDIDEELRNCDACIRYVVTKAGFHPAASIQALLPGDHWQMDCAAHMPESQTDTRPCLWVDVCTDSSSCARPC